MRSPQLLRLDVRHLIVPIALLLPSCFLIPSKDTECSDKRACQAGYSCDRVTAMCVKDAEPDMSVVDDLSEPPDLSEADLVPPPDFLPPPDISPVCTTDAPCATGLACLKDADPLKNRCAPCTTDAQCESGVCDLNTTATFNGGSVRGYCPRKAEVVYVDNDMAKCTGGDGTDAKPLCTLQAGVDALGAAKKWVKVAASATAYAKITVAGKTGTIYGPATAMGTIPGAQIGGTAGMDTVALSGTSDLSIFGMDISGGARGVVCSGNATTKLALRRSVVRSATGVGVDVTGCAVEIDRALIRENQGGGALITSAAAMSMTNNLIVTNGAVGYTGQAIRFVTSVPAGALFRFNTVADNINQAGNRGGIACPVGSNFEIRDSIVSGNRIFNSSQFAGDCALVKTAVGLGDMTIGNVNNSVNPVFAADYKLNNVADNDTCCVDKGSNTASTTLPVDYFGNTRPDCTMNKCDIGAHELK